MFAVSVVNTRKPKCCFVEGWKIVAKWMYENTCMRQTSLTGWLYRINPKHTPLILLARSVYYCWFIFNIGERISCQASGKDFISLLLQFMIWNDKKDLLVDLVCLIFHAVESSEGVLAVYPFVWCVPCVVAIAAICCVPAATVCSLFYHSHLNEPHSQLEKGDLTANQPPQQ